MNIIGVTLQVLSVTLALVIASIAVYYAGRRFIRNTGDRALPTRPFRITLEAVEATIPRRHTDSQPPAWLFPALAPADATRADVPAPAESNSPDRVDELIAAQVRVASDTLAGQASDLDVNDDRTGVIPAWIMPLLYCSPEHVGRELEKDRALVGAAA